VGQFTQSHAANQRARRHHAGTNDASRSTGRSQEFVGDYEALIDTYAPSQNPICLTLCPTGRKDGFNIWADRERR
jgi:hypothetical protein